MAQFTVDEDNNICTIKFNMDDRKAVLDMLNKLAVAVTDAAPSVATAIPTTPVVAVTAAAGAAAPLAAPTTPARQVEKEKTDEKKDETKKLEKKDETEKKEGDDEAAKEELRKEIVAKFGDACVGVNGKAERVELLYDRIVRKLKCDAKDIQQMIDATKLANAKKVAPTSKVALARLIVELGIIEWTLSTTAPSSPAVSTTSSADATSSVATESAAGDVMSPTDKTQRQKDAEDVFRTVFPAANIKMFRRNVREFLNYAPKQTERKELLEKSDAIKGKFANADELILAFPSEPKKKQ